jgi:peptidylprolyl isomerase
MGFTKEVLTEGDPTKGPTKNKEVTVHCTGFGKNGDLKAKFWSTKDPGQGTIYYICLSHFKY